MGNFASRRARSGHHKALASAVAFLRQLGMDVAAADAPAGCFLPGVWFEGAALRYDPRRAHVGDLLHEAGHAAVLPSELRGALGVGDLERNKALDGRRLDAAEVAMWESLAASDERGPRDLAAILNADENAAIAWSYAAAFAANIDPARVLDVVTWFSPGHQGPVRDGGRRVRRALDRDLHPGIRGLVDAGMATRADFPFMARWLQR